MVNGKRVVGIIAEFNPFHKGHAYIISRAKEICSADCVVIVMSGDFVQRGAPAIFSKYDRAHTALSNGADLVLQLPVLFSTASAEDFAAAALAVLEKTGIVDVLAFGSESGELARLQRAADCLTEESEAYKMQLRAALKSGKSYPEARAMALAQVMDEEEDTSFAANDILGISYLKALKRQKSGMKVCLIRREQALGSAHAARERYYSGELEAPGKYVTIDDFSGMLSYKLLSLKAAGADLSVYQDVSRELSNRMLADAEKPLSFTERIAAAKTRQYTWTRVSRCFIHILLDIFASEYAQAKAHGYVDAVRVLGLRSGQEALLSALHCPAVTSVARAEQNAAEDSVLLQKDIFAAHVYNAVHGNFQTEYTRKLLKTML